MKNNKLQEAKHYIAKLIAEQEAPEETKTVAALADKFRDLSISIRKGEYKGLQAQEINTIDDLVNFMLQGSSEGNFSTILNRIQAILSKSVKSTPDSSDTEPELDIEDETI
jgi:hypothetical protein